MGLELCYENKYKPSKSGCVEDSDWSIIDNGDIKGRSTTVDNGSGVQVSLLDQEQLDACDVNDIGLADIDSYDSPIAKDWPYGFGCPFGSKRPEKKCKFKPDKDGEKWFYENVCYKSTEALGHAQTSAFVSIVIVQWADLLICKTRSLSIYHQGMKNPILIFGMFTETLLCLALCYIPGVDVGLGTRPLSYYHWMPSMPYSMLIFVYDECRKAAMRHQRVKYPGKISFVERFSYY